MLITTPDFQMSGQAVLRFLQLRQEKELAKHQEATEEARALKEARRLQNIAEDNERARVEEEATAYVVREKEETRIQLWEAHANAGGVGG